MKPTADHIRHRAEARTMQGDPHAVGWIAGYVDAPTVILVTDDGERVSWRADLTTIIGSPVDDDTLAAQVVSGTRTTGLVIQWRPAGTDRWSDYTQPPTEDDAVESLRLAREASPASEFQCVQWWHRTEVLDL